MIHCINQGSHIKISILSKVEFFLKIVFVLHVHVANSVVPDEMPPHVAFYLGLHIL